MIATGNRRRGRGGKAQAPAGHGGPSQGPNYSRQKAVRTSVLAPRGRHLWKYVCRLDITSPWDDYDEPKEPCSFINALLLLRDHVILDEVKLDCDSYLHKKEHVNIWVRHALMWQPKELNVYISGDSWISLEGSPLVSRHLRKLELYGVRLKHKVLDFASCPALEVLEMKTCKIKTKRIFLQSIKILCIESSTFSSSDRDRTRISALSLIRLQLHGFRGKAPLIESMPSLETASVKPPDEVDDSCDKGDSRECCGICADCCGDDDHKGRCVLLEGLSSAVNLELTAYRGMEPKFTAQMDGNNPLEKSAVISKCLKIIKIKCNDVDDRVYKVLKFLCTLDIEITVKRNKFFLLRFLSLVMGVLLMMGSFDVSRLNILVTATVSVKAYAGSDGTIFIKVAITTDATATAAELVTVATPSKSWRKWMSLQPRQRTPQHPYVRTSRLAAHLHGRGGCLSCMMRVDDHGSVSSLPCWSRPKSHNGLDSELSVAPRRPDSLRIRVHADEATARHHDCGGRVCSVISRGVRRLRIHTSQWWLVTASEVALQPLFSPAHQQRPHGIDAVGLCRHRRCPHGTPGKAAEAPVRRSSRLRPSRQRHGCATATLGWCPLPTCTKWRQPGDARTA
ncbi:hypothetical protein PR202_gb16286 [Eleusine coracana subsp. coracana]|uniref:FBD domain-containing protein n=1 Tax=Eleusine coracana subsp. coracana TaxID=191504 RepID=A0AAV5EZY8_ELECO|nr:hypothetical protein PR202_gb16286 [Eleusine coracana subsp. coracana]